MSIVYENINNSCAGWGDVGSNPDEGNQSPGVASEAETEALQRSTTFEGTEGVLSVECECFQSAEVSNAGVDVVRAFLHEDPETGANDK